MLKTRQPAHINPYQKEKFGWVTPITLTAGSSVSNMSASANNAVIYRIVANADGEHYLLENRQLVGFDASMRGRGHGLLIWHIANNVASFPNSPNNSHRQQVYPVCASSTVAVPDSAPSSYGNINSDGCPFPGTSMKTYYTGYSTPRSFSLPNNSLGNFITDITENTTTKTVSFNLPPSFSFDLDVPSTVYDNQYYYNFGITNVTSWVNDYSNSYCFDWYANTVYGWEPIGSWCNSYPTYVWFDNYLRYWYQRGATVDIKCVISNYWTEQYYEAETSVSCPDCTFYYSPRGSEDNDEEALETEDTEEQIDIYPNPVTKILNVDLENNSKYTILRIYNSLGIEIQNVSPINASNHINVQNLPLGAYSIILTSNGSTKSFKFLKQ